MGSPSHEKSLQLHLRVSGELKAALERELERLQVDRPGSVVHVADVVREVLWRSLCAPSASLQQVKGPGAVRAKAEARESLPQPTSRREGGR